MFVIVRDEADRWRESAEISLNSRRDSDVRGARIHVMWLLLQRRELSNNTLKAKEPQGSPIGPLWVVEWRDGAREWRSSSWTGLSASECLLTWFEFAAAPSERLSHCNINSPSCSIWKFKHDLRGAVKGSVLAKPRSWSHVLVVDHLMESTVRRHHLQAHEAPLLKTQSQAN